MTKLVFVDPSGTACEVEGTLGCNLMQVAIDNGVAGILGDCGGCCSCATCHVYVDPAWIDRLPVPGSDENMTLGCVMHRRPNSRLACQLFVDPAISGLRLRVAHRQI